MSWVLEKIEGTPYTRLKNVPIVSTGIEYKIQTHPEGVTFSEDMLADAVLAPLDPAIVDPRLGIGHHDPRFDSPEFDGEPAVGRVENMTLGNNGQTIYGDYVTWDWLAEMIPLAYPNRSMEGGKNVQPMWIENHKTVTGKKYRMVITGVALLGMNWPGCSTLEDLQLLASGEGVTINEGGRIEAAMNIEDVRTRYYDYLNAAGDAFYRWWIRGMRLDPNELVVDDDGGNLFRVPFTVDGESVEFGEPAPVVVDYRDVPASVAAGIYTEGLFGGRQEQDEVVLFASRAESRPESVNQGGQMTPEERNALCASLGLDAAATDDQIREKLTAGGLLQASTPGDGEPAPEGEPEGDPDPEGEPAPEGEPEGDPTVQAGLPETVTITKADLERLKLGASAALEDREARIKSENDQIMAGAIGEGRFAPAQSAEIRKGLDNPQTREMTINWIKSLSAGVVPVTARGTSRAGEEVEAGAEGSGNLGLPWFQREHARASKILAGEVTAGNITADAKYGNGDRQVTPTGVN